MNVRIWGAALLVALVAGPALAQAPPPPPKDDGSCDATTSLGAASWSARSLFADIQAKAQPGPSAGFGQATVMAAPGMVLLTAIPGEKTSAAVSIEFQVRPVLVATGPGSAAVQPPSGPLLAVAFPVDALGLANPSAAFMDRIIAATIAVEEAGGDSSDLVALADAFARGVGFANGGGEIQIFHDTSFWSSVVMRIPSPLQGQHIAVIAVWLGAEEYGVAATGISIQNDFAGALCARLGLLESKLEQLAACCSKVDELSNKVKALEEKLEECCEKGRDGKCGERDDKRKDSPCDRNQGSGNDGKCDDEGGGKRGGTTSTGCNDRDVKGR